MIDGKLCMDYEVESIEPRGKPKIMWKEVVGRDLGGLQLNKEYAVVHS